MGVGQRTGGPDVLPVVDYRSGPPRTLLRPLKSRPRKLNGRSSNPGVAGQRVRIAGGRLRLVPPGRVQGNNGPREGRPLARKRVGKTRGSLRRASGNSSESGQSRRSRTAGFS